MTVQLQFDPNATFENVGWTLTGGSLVHSILSSASDASYLKAPATSGRVSIEFPLNTSSVPTGAKIKSVTLYVRANRTSSTIRPLTIQLAAKDFTSRFFSRTCYPTQTIADIKVATYHKDPRGRKWDIFSINKLLCRILSSARVFDCIRVYRYYCVIDYVERPTTTIIEPSGTVYTPTPTLSWTYAHDEGEPHLKSQYKIFTDSVCNQPWFNPFWVRPVINEFVEQDTLSETLPTSLNPGTYHLFVRTWSVNGARSLWARQQFTVDSPSPSPPGDDNQSETGTPGLGTLTATGDSDTSSYSLTGRDSTNLLSVQQADFEHATDPLEYVAGNCTLARSLAQFYPGGGEASMSLTASSAAEMTADTTFFEVGSRDIEAGGTIPYTVRCQFKAGSTARTCRLDTLFYDQNFNLLQTDTGAGSSDSTSTWTEIVETGSVNASAYYAKVRIAVESPASSEVHYVDHVGFMYGNGSQWSNGGFASSNILSSALATGDDPQGSVTWTAANAQSSVTQVTTTGTGSHGTKTHQMSFSSASPSIAHRSTGTQYSSPTSGTNFTLNKPASVVDGDLYVAYVSVNVACTMSTVPSGWTLVSTSSADSGTEEVTLFVLTRDALAADGSTWTDGVISAAATNRSAIVVCYSGTETADNAFIANAARSDISGTTAHTTATVTNTDSNAWRLTAFAYNDNVSGGTSTANVQPPSAPPAISYVGKGPVWGTNTSGTTYIIYRPSNVQTNDLLIAHLAFTGEVTTVTPPSGWTLVETVSQDNGGNSSPESGASTLAILKRTAGASEPSSWSGTIGNSSNARQSAVTAYRGAETAANQFIDTATSTEDASSSDDINTGVVTNTDARSWRIVSAVHGHESGTVRLDNPTEHVERVDSDSDYAYQHDVALAVMDSNGPVSTGDHQRHIDWNRNADTMCSWIAIIKPLPSITPPGNETERLDDSTGASDPFMYHAVYDSGTTVAAGSHNITVAVTPGSGTAVDCMASWIGILRPAGAVENAEVAAELTSSIDISSVDQTVLTLCNRQMSFVGSFLGSAGGTPIFELEFYRANELITTNIVEGQPFETATWKKAHGVFTLPTGTTHILPRIKVQDRANADTVKFDRLGLQFGTSDVWRNGTGRNEHPVWHLPVLQYADDDGTGYGAWTNIYGQDTLYAPAYSYPSGVLSYTDHTAVPLSTRKYRSRTLSYGLNGDTFISEWGPESAEASFSATTWWLKDLSNLDNNMPLKVRLEMPVSTVNTAAVFQPLGEDFPVVVSQGYKADSLEITAICTHAQFVALAKLLRSGKSLYLQSRVDKAWWVRPVDALESDLLPTSQFATDPLRDVKLKFVQVKPEE